MRARTKSSTRPRWLMCIHFIRTLSHGYDTMLNEEANNISQGEKQLLTIARAILKDPQILILDEATQLGRYAAGTDAAGSYAARHAQRARALSSRTGFPPSANADLNPGHASMGISLSKARMRACWPSGASNEKALQFPSLRTNRNVSHEHRQKRSLLPVSDGLL